MRGWRSRRSEEILLRVLLPRRHWYKDHPSSKTPLIPPAENSLLCSSQYLTLLLEPSGYPHHCSPIRAFCGGSAWHSFYFSFPSPVLSAPKLTAVFGMRQCSVSVCLDERTVFLRGLALFCLSFKAGKREQVPKSQWAPKAQLCCTHEPLAGPQYPGQTGNPSLWGSRSSATWQQLNLEHLPLQNPAGFHAQL